MLWDSHSDLTTKRNNSDLGSDRLQHRDMLGIPMVSLHVGQIGQLGPGIWQSLAKVHLGNSGIIRDNQGSPYLSFCPKLS